MRDNTMTLHSFSATVRHALKCCCMFTFVAIVNLVFTSNAIANKRTEAEHQITQLAQWQAAVSQSDFSGLVMVAHKGEAVFQYKFGLANREQNIPFSQNTVFDIGSITKQFTATAIIQLSEAGKLSVQDRITRFFPNVPSDKQNITLHHLLTHSSGLPHGFGLYQKVTRAEFIKTAMAAPLKFEPGAQYSYSNAGYSLLAAVIEQVSGQGYEHYLQTHIFHPAGLNDTGYQRVERRPENIAVHYGRDPNWFQRLLIVKAQSRSVGHSLAHQYRDPGPRWYLLGGGGMLSTTYDMLRWYQTIRTKNPTIMKRTSWNRLFNQYVAENDKKEAFYGYGWRVSKDDMGRSVVSHNGSNGYNLTEFTYYPKLDMFVFKTTNNWDDSPEALINQFDHIAIKEIIHR